MTFKCRFNATCFLFKINRFVLIFSKTSNRFVLKICSGGFADYNKLSLYKLWNKRSCFVPKRTQKSYQTSQILSKPSIIHL